MEAGTTKPKRKRSVKRILLWILAGFIIIISIAAFLLYNNFNRLLSNALMKSFNSGSISDVYELKFEKLSVNLFLGNISVYDVELKPREKPLHNYPYINTTFNLKTHKILLTNVEIFTLLKESVLKLEKIEITKPEVELNITDAIPTLFPFKDTTAVTTLKEPGKKKAIEAFSLKEFDLIHAAFHVVNTAKQREFRIQDFNISVRDLLIAQQPGRDVISYDHIKISLGELTGKLQKEAVKYVSFRNFNINVDSLAIQKSIDTLIYHFADFSTGINDLDIQTADSIFHVTMLSFNLSYKDKSIKLKDVSFKPNISEAAMQAKYQFQNTQFSGSVGSINLLGINFDSLIYHKKLFIDEVDIDKVSASIFKDKTKPMDTKKFPEYLGQTVKKIPLPLLVKQVKATNANLINREKNPDGTYATAHLNRATLEAKNITNILMDAPLSMKADAYVENKVHLVLSLGFSYQKPEFTMNGKLDKFNLPDLNPLIQAYSPAKVNKGIVDEISFSGTAYQTNATGTMKFLYHDLDIDIDLEGKAKWKSSLLAFGANTFLPTANPASADKPQRIVKFSAERDMNKAFINLIIKSVLNGLKETLIMSKENKQTYREKKKELKKEKKEQNKKEKN